MQRIEVFTDGSSRPRTKETAGWAAAFEMNGKIHVFYGHFPAPSTNNVGELGAVLYMIKMFVKADVSFDFSSDSQYVQKGIEEWRINWEKRGWRNNQGKPIGNKEKWLELFSIWDKRDHTIRWDRGHNGLLMNEIADYWANRGADDQRIAECCNNNSLNGKFWRDMSKYGHLGEGMPGDIIHKVDFLFGFKYDILEKHIKELKDE